MPRPARDDSEKSFAELAPVYDAFPGFVEKDFAAFEKRKQRDELFNGERLLVRRKLAALGRPIAARLAAAGLELDAKTSLSHPYTYNGFRVASMWAYFGRGERAKRAVKQRLGAELGKDVDPTYQGLILLVEIGLSQRDEPEIACGLKIHPAAWWDGKNLEHKIKRKEGAAKELTALLNALPRGYAMTIGDWRRRYEAGKLHEADVANYFRFYRPGEVWLHLLHETPARDAIAAGASFAERAASLLEALVPIHRFASWSPENDHVLGPR